jgi:PAS domain S-box-containing protein
MQFHVQNSNSPNAEPAAGHAQAHSSPFADTAVIQEPRASVAAASLTPDALAALQVSQTVRAIPLLLLFHVSAIVSLNTLAEFRHSPLALGLWHGFAAAVALAALAFHVLWRRGHWQTRPARVLHGLELMSLLLALVWVIPIAIFTQVKPATNVVPVAGVTLTMLSIGVVSLMRVPTGAVVFVSLLSAALATALYQSLDSNRAMVAILCAIYCLVLIGITINSHLDFRRRFRAEMEIRHQKDVIKLLLNDFERDASDWLWETDTQDRLTYVSPRLVDILGKPAEVMLLQPLRLLLTGFTSNAEIQRLDDALAQHERITALAMEMRLHGETAFWQFTAQPRKESDGTWAGYRGVCRDITLAREAQRRIELAMEASEKANAAKSHFLAVMSHELRTPINSIVGFSEMLAQDRTGSLAPAARMEFSETVLESSRHLQNLINDLLDATRMEHGSFTLHEQDADAAELVEVAIKLCRDQAERVGVNIEAHLADGVTLIGDVTRLKQVIINLLTNAVKFSPQNNVVTVEMQRARGGQFIIAVTDSGIGISPEDMEKIFDPFVQADAGMTRRFGGVGLGLPIARRIARLHGGDVTLASTKDHGTMARLILPAKRVTWPGARGSAVKDVA